MQTTNLTLSELFKDIVIDIVQAYPKNGFTIANHLNIRDVFYENITLDVKQCQEILDFLRISEKNVLRYLGGKYTYTLTDKKIVFKQDLKCLDNYDFKTKTLTIKSSEPHKMLTDILYVNSITPIDKLNISIKEIKFSGLMVVQYYLFLRSVGLFSKVIDYLIHSNEYIQRNKLMRITKHYHRLYQICGGKSDLKSYMYDDKQISELFNKYVNGKI